MRNGRKKTQGTRGGTGAWGGAYSGWDGEGKAGGWSRLSKGGVQVVGDDVKDVESCGECGMAAKKRKEREEVPAHGAEHTRDGTAKGRREDGRGCPRAVFRSSATM